MDLPTPTHRPRPVFSWSLLLTAFATALASTALDYDHASPDAQARALAAWTAFEPAHVTLTLDPKAKPYDELHVYHDGSDWAFDATPGAIK